MNVLMVSSMSGMGGTERSTQQLCKLMVDRGHNVFLLCTDGPLVNDIRNSGVKVFITRTHSKNPISLFCFCRDARNVIIEHNINVIHSQMAFTVPFLSLSSFFSFRKVKRIWHARGLRANTYNYICRLFSVLNVFCIANCKTEMKKLISKGYSQKLVGYAYNLSQIDINHRCNKGFFRKKFNVSDSAIVLGSMSRLSEERGVHYAVKYFSTLVESKLSNRELYLFIAGDGPELSRLKDLVYELGLKGRVYFLGAVSDVADFYSDVDIFWNPLSVKKGTGAGTGNTLIEAAFMKVPIVSHDAIGVHELVIDGVTGYLTDIGDEKDFINKTVLILDDDSKKERLINACYQRVFEQCSKEKVAMRIEGYYQKDCYL